MQLIDTFPTDRIGDLEYRVGRVLPFGATITDGGVNFSIFSKEATGCTLLLYHHGDAKPFVEIPFPEEFRIGNVYTMMVFGIQIETTEYGYRFDGVWDPAPGPLCQIGLRPQRMGQAPEIESGHRLRPPGPDHPRGL